MSLHTAALMVIFTPCNATQRQDRYANRTPQGKPPHLPQTASKPLLSFHRTMPPPAPVATSAVTTAVLQLYRRIIKNAKVFPSKGRDRMVKEIREGK